MEDETVMEDRRLGVKKGDGSSLLATTGAAALAAATAAAVVIGALLSGWRSALLLEQAAEFCW
jgi:hypothetical protein